MSFGENLQSIRKLNQLSQEDLAEMLGVSRQAVSKWEIGEGYPEVDKLLILSQRLNVSLDSLMGNGTPAAAHEERPAPDSIRIISPHEGVSMIASKVIRSQKFRGGAAEPQYALFASDGKEASPWGAQNTFLAWYRNLEDVTREIEEIQKALEAGEAAYTLQYSVRCRKSLFRRTIEEDEPTENGGKTALSKDLMVLSPNRKVLLSCREGIKQDGCTIMVQTKKDGWIPLCYYKTPEEATDSMQKILEAMKNGEKYLEL